MFAGDERPNWYIPYEYTWDYKGVRTVPHNHTGDLPVKRNNFVYLHL